MTTEQLSDWSKRQPASGAVHLVKGHGGLPLVRVETATSTAEIYLQGAHVSHFQIKGQEPMLFMSGKSRFEPNIPIRGGIPLILPWFGPREGLAAHGWARNKAWDLQTITPEQDGSISVSFVLESPGISGFGPFKSEYAVNVGTALSLELRVTNQATDQDLVFENCLHTYFVVKEAADLAVAGLKGTRYLDKVGGITERTETAEFITISSEVDRVYYDTAARVEIIDPGLKRIIRVEKLNSQSTVVWNPWIAKAKAMPDFGDEEYHGMVCVESGNVGPNRLTLAPGKTETLKVRLSFTGI